MAVKPKLPATLQGLTQLDSVVEPVPVSCSLPSGSSAPQSSTCSQEKAQWPCVGSSLGCRVSTDMHTTTLFARSTLTFQQHLRYSSKPVDKSPSQKNIATLKAAAKKSKYLQAAVIQSRIQAGLKKNNVIQDVPTNPITLVSHKPVSKPTPVDLSRQDQSPNLKALRQQLGTNPFLQEADIALQHALELNNINQSFSNQTLGEHNESSKRMEAIAKMHNFAGSPTQQKAPSVNANIIHDVPPHYQPDQSDHLQEVEQPSSMLAEEIEQPKDIDHSIFNEARHSQERISHDRAAMMQELSSKLYANVAKPKSKNKTPTRKTPRVQGYIDNVHDLCLHNASELFEHFKKPRTSQGQAQNESSSRKVTRDKSRNAKSQLKSPMKKNIDKMYAVTQETHQNGNNTSLIQQANALQTSQQYYQHLQPPFGGNTTTQYGGVNLVLPIQQFRSSSPNPGVGLPSSEFLSLKEISETLGHKIDSIQHQIRNMTPTRDSTANEGNYPRTGRESPNLRPRMVTNKDTQTHLDEAARLQYEEIQGYKFQIYKLQEQVKLLDERLLRDHELHKEKVLTLQTHIKMLQDDNLRLSESLKSRKDTIQGSITAQIKVKDSLIEELTSKLKESTKVIQHIKLQNKKLKDDVQQAHVSASENFESQLGEARRQIEDQLQKQLNSSISEHLTKQFEEKINEVKSQKTQGDGQKYKQLLIEKEREYQEQIQLLQEKHEAALRATEQAITEARKAVESRKTGQTDLQKQLQDKMLADFQAKMADAQQQLLQKDALIESLQSKSSKQVDPKALEKVKQEMAQTSQQLDSKLKEAIQDAMAKDRTIKEQEAKLHEIESERLKKDNRIKALTSESESLKQQFARQIEAIKTAQSESEKFNLQQLTDSQRKIAELENQLKRSKEASASLESQLSKKIGTDPQEASMIQAITQQFQLKLQQADADLSNSKKAQKDAEAQKNELQAKADELQAEIEKLKSSQQSDKNEIDKLKESKKDLTLKMAQSQKDNLMKKKEEEKMKKQLAKAQEELKEKATEVDDLEKEHIEQLSYLNTLKTSESSLKLTIETQTQQLEQLTAEVEELRKRETENLSKSQNDSKIALALQTSAQKAAETGAQLAKITKEFEQFKAQKQKSDDEMTETFMSEMQAAESKLEAKTAEADKFAKDVQRLTNELKNAEQKTQQMSQLTIEVEELRKRESEHLERQRAESKIALALQTSAQKAAETGAQLAQITKQYEQLKAQKKSDDEMTSTLMSEMQAAESKLEAKTAEADKFAKDVQRLTIEVKNADQKVQQLNQALTEAMSLKSTELDGHEKKHLEQVNKMVQIQGELQQAQTLVQTQAMQISELKSQAAKEAGSRKEAEGQMKAALEAALIKSTEGATQLGTVKAEIERVKADAKKNQDTLTQTFMIQIGDLERQLKTKADEASKLAQAKTDLENTNAQKQSTESQIAMALQQTSMKAAESAAMVSKLQKELEQQKTAAKQSEDEMTQTFMSELQDAENKLTAKTAEADKFAKEMQRLANEVMQKDEKAKQLVKQLNEAIQAKSEAEELTEMTVKKIKDEQDKKIASLTQELETTRQMKKDSSARRLSETEQIKSRMEQDKDNTKIMLQTLTQELQNNEKQITAEREKSKKLNDQVLSLKDEKQSLMEDLGEKNKLISSLEKGAGATATLATELATTKQQLSDGIAELARTKQTLAQQTMQSKVAQDAFQESTKLMQEQMTKLQKELADLKAQQKKDAAALETTVQKNMEQLMAKDQELEALRKQSGGASNTAQVAELQKKVQAAEMEKQMNQVVIQQINQEVERLTKQNAQLQQQSDKSPTQGASMTKLKDMQNKLASAEQSDQMKTQIIEQLNQEMKKKDAALAQAKQQEKQLTEMMTQLTVQMSMVQSSKR